MEFEKSESDDNYSSWTLAESIMALYKSPVSNKKLEQISPLKMTKVNKKEFMY